MRPEAFLRMRSIAGWRRKNAGMPGLVAGGPSLRRPNPRSFVASTAEALPQPPFQRS